jgi:ParB family chromosome partitioning protein
MTARTDQQELIYTIPLKDILISDKNVRQTQQERGLDELAASIEKLGLLQPVVLLGSYEDGPPFELIVGQRRFLAHKKILAKKGPKWGRIHAVFAGDLDATEATIRSLVENMHRADLNHADAAKAITDLYTHYGGRYNKDDRRVARETGLSLQRVRQYVEIEQLASPAMKKALKDQRVAPIDVKRALRAAGGNITKAERLLDLMVEHELTPYEKRRLVEVGQSDPEAPAPRMVKEAQRPRVEEVLMVSLPEDLRLALQLAVEALDMEPEELAAEAIKGWLSDQGFYTG